MRRLAYPAGFVLVTLGLTAYGALAAGKATGSALFLGLAGGVLVVSVVLLGRAAGALFVDPPAGDVAVATGRRRKELEREKTAILKAIKELEFDHEMRKVSDADFAEIGGVYRARAIRVMRQLEDKQVDYASLVEEELAKTRRAKPTKAQVELVESGLAMIKAEAVALEAGALSASARDCQGCGTRNDGDAVFCKKCAARLVPAEGAA